MPRLLVTLTSAPSVDADPLEVERMQVQLRTRAPGGPATATLRVPTALSYSLRLTTSR